MKPRILIAEISGKRPGDVKARPTEKFETQHDCIIISNNSEGYITEWPILNVPDDYREWYKSKIKNSENMWYAQMNRSYAIKYAKENGYDYLVQLDDNITMLEIAYRVEIGNIVKSYKVSSNKMMDDFIEMFISVLENTNAVMAGCNMCSMMPVDNFLSERYVYSCFCIKLSDCPDVFQGDFEDDIEYRLKCMQMGLPVLQIVPFRYGKTAQKSKNDKTGCREEYARAGCLRGDHMLKLYSDYYSCGMTNRSKGTNCRVDEFATTFRHSLKPFRLGTIVYDYDAILECFNRIIEKYPDNRNSQSKIRVKRMRVTK